MKSFRLFFLLVSCTAVTFAATDDAKNTAPGAPAAIAEHDRLVQEFLAERAKLVEARQELKEKAKKARTEKNAKDLKKAQEEIAALEQDFKTRNAELIRQIKAKDEEKKGPKPSKAGS